MNIGGRPATSRASLRRLTQSLVKKNRVVATMHGMEIRVNIAELAAYSDEILEGEI